MTGIDGLGRGPAAGWEVPTGGDAGTPGPVLDAGATVASGLPTAQLLLAKRIAANPRGPIPVRGDRYEYEATLQALSQVDSFDDTRYDAMRCGAEATVAAMLVRGKRGFGECLEALRGFAGTAGRAPQWQNLLHECMEVRRAY